MKTLIYSILALFATTLNAQIETATLNVTIDNVVNNEGEVHIALYDQSTFMKAAPLKAISLAIEDGVVKATFEAIPKGNYGIIAFHDKNSNGRMDFETNGMPSEDYGTSNNIMSFGPPRWDDSQFSLGEDTTIKIRL